MYALCDLDGVPIYVGQTESTGERGIIGRVRRHLTSARSDIVANLQIDVWEIASVRAWPEPEKGRISDLERRVHHEYRSTILAGRALARPGALDPLPPYQECRILPEDEVERRRDPATRLVRQVRHIDHLLDVIVTRKDSTDQRRSLASHLVRLQQRFDEFTCAAAPEQEADED